MTAPTRARRWRVRPALAAVAVLLAVALVPAIGRESTEPAAAPIATPIPAAVGGPAPPPATASARADLPAPSAAAPAPWGTLSADTSEARRYEQALAAALEASEADGVSVAIARNGVLVWAGAGGVAVDGVSPMTSDTATVVGSLTKTFVAALVLQLAEEGRLALDDTLAAHLPDLGIPGADAITVRQLLDHTSGLADLFNETTRIGLETDPDHTWTTEEILGTLHEPWYEPGENWAYANTNYLLLGLVAERAGGEPLGDAIAHRFLGPLELAHTRLLGPSDPAPVPLADAWTSLFWASGAMEASAVDVARWGEALYGGTVLRPETMRQMLDFNGHEHGLGTQHLEFGPIDGHGHTGLLDRYTSLLFHDPASRTTIAMLANVSRADLEAMLTARPIGGPSLLRLATELGD